VRVITAVLFRNFCSVTQAAIISYTNRYANCDTNCNTNCHRDAKA
jgi:hypothetical protein